MSHTHKDAVGGHSVAYHKVNRFSKRFHKREARREQSAIINAALHEFFTEQSIEDEIELDDFYSIDDYDEPDYDDPYYDEPSYYEPDYFAEYDEDTYYGYYDEF